MYKEQLKKIIKQIEKVFKGDQEALAALRILGERADNLKSQDELQKEDHHHFPIPAEVAGEENAYAIFSDGACRGNPGPGAWAAIIQNKEGIITFQDSGVEALTTNNRMELIGAIKGLEKTAEYFLEMNYEKKPPVFLFSDSKYLIDGMNGWVEDWKKRGWKKADNKKPDNLDLWQRLDELRNNLLPLHFIWVKGHDGYLQNEYCDQMANTALDHLGF